MFARFGVRRKASRLEPTGSKRTRAQLSFPAVSSTSQLSAAAVTQSRSSSMPFNAIARPVGGKTHEANEQFVFVCLLLSELTFCPSSRGR